MAIGLNVVLEGDRRENATTTIESMAKLALLNGS